MKLHLAGDGSRYKDVAYDTGVPWVMTSYYYHRDSPTSGSGGAWKLDYRSEPTCKGLMMDSGAFSYINALTDKPGTDVDWYDYAERYARYVKEHEVERWIELDLDSVMGLEFTREIREYMEDIVGWQCIPVWHRNRGKRAYKRIATDYKRVALGGFPWNEIAPSEYHHLPWFINEAHKRDARVHALGFQPRLDKVDRYPFDSSDSSNWRYATYGQVHEFDGRDIEYIRHDKKVTPDMYRHNIREWVKYANHVDGRNEVELGFEW